MKKIYSNTIKRKQYKKIKDLETNLIELYKAITSYDNGRLKNLSSKDKIGYEILKKNFGNHEDMIFAYVSLMSDDKTGHIPLPPFIVFPIYSPVTIGWRMGCGEEYEELWEKKICTLSQADLEKYCKNFDYPEWWIEDFPFKETTLRPRYFNLPWKNYDLIN